MILLLLVPNGLSAFLGSDTCLSSVCSYSLTRRIIWHLHTSYRYSYSRYGYISSALINVSASLVPHTALLQWSHLLASLLKYVSAYSQSLLVFMLHHTISSWQPGRYCWLYYVGRSLCCHLTLVDCIARHTQNTYTKLCQDFFCQNLFVINHQFVGY